ncbi:MAG: ATP-binding protein, partial [Alphaproteobacteria bacterium]
MLEVTEKEIKKRLAFDNPWWEEGEVHQRFRDWPRRAHFDGFYGLFKESTVQRAVVLMGPRRVGKTVMLTQAVQRLIDDKIEAKRIFYVSVDTPTYIGLSLEKMLRLFMEIHGHKRDAHLFVMFDEVQYLKDWERHLKSLVDSFPSIRFVASGSAAAALKMKSQESGAGRFTDFLLPPLSFAEFLRFTGRMDEIFVPGEFANPGLRPVRDIDALNVSFLDYTNYGGFPEAVIDESVRKAMDRFIANDVIDK